tara:strand:+ start:2267 stop:3589 length:1323 start_codon:yes stop_codon:yes gene_type:complete
MAFNEKTFREEATKKGISDDQTQAALDEYYKNNKIEPAPIVETAKSMVDLFTTKHPTLGISPADVALYAGGAGAAFAAGKKAIDLAGQGLSAAGTAVKNKIFGQAGSSVPPTNPTASTQALMTVPDIEKPIVQTNLSIQDAADRMASLQPKTPIEKAEALLGQDSPSAINRSVPPTMGPNQFTGSTPPGTFSSPAAPIGGMTSPAPTPSVTPEITGQTGAAAEPPAVKATRAAKRSTEQMAIDKAAKAVQGPENWLINNLGGKENYQSFIDTFNNGKPYSSLDEVYKTVENNLGGPNKSEFRKAGKDISTARQREVGPVKPGPKELEKFKQTGKLSGGATPGMLLGLAGNLLGGVGIAKALKEGDTASAGLGAIDQILANTAMLAGKKGALGAIGSAAGRLSPFMIGMTPTAVSSGTLNSPEAQALFRNARPTGAVPPPR